MEKTPPKPQPKTRKIDWEKVKKILSETKSLTP